MVDVESSAGVSDSVGISGPFAPKAGQSGNVETRCFNLLRTHANNLTDPKNPVFDRTFEDAIVAIGVLPKRDPDPSLAESKVQAFAVWKCALSAEDLLESTSGICDLYH